MRASRLFFGVVVSCLHCLFLFVRVRRFFLPAYCVCIVFRAGSEAFLVGVLGFVLIFLAGYVVLLVGV